MNAFLPHLLWIYLFQIQPVCTAMCDGFMGLAGVSHPTSVAFLALLAMVASVFLVVLCLDLIIGGAAGEARNGPTCPHKIRDGKFCPVCARDADVVAEIHQKLRTAQARR